MAEQHTAVSNNVSLDEFIDPDFKLTRLVYAFVICAVIWLILGTLVGFYLAIRFVWPDLGAVATLSFGRLRAVHTNVVFWAWSTMGMLAMAHYVVPRTSHQELHSHRLPWVSLVLLNAVAVAGVIALVSGVNNGDQEYREFIWPIMAVFDLAAVLTGYNFARTIMDRRTRHIYISNWWIVAALLMGFILITVSYLPWYQHGIGETVVQGYYMHMGVGQWFTPMVLGLTYYALPRILNKPIFSYSLGVLAFWTQIIFYTMIGSHHFIWGPIPWSLQTVAIIFSVGMLIPVVAGTSNFLLTMGGSRWSIAHSYALPFILVGVIFYFFASGQGTTEAFRSLSGLWHFTNFTIAHSHMTMYGFVAFLIWGSTYGLLPRITGNSPPRGTVRAHFWLALIGVLIYAWALMIGGTEQGQMWWAGRPFIDSVKVMHTYWLWRAIGGGMMFISHFVFAYNVWAMRPNAATVALREAAQAQRSGKPA